MKINLYVNKMGYVYTSTDDSYADKSNKLHKQLRLIHTYEIPEEIHPSHCDRPTNSATVRRNLSGNIHTD